MLTPLAIRHCRVAFLSARFYTYDDNGNITSVVQDGVTTSYTYDALGQLIRVVDGHEGATWEYSYDQGGNILSKKKYVNGVETESMDFEYTNENWRDQLTKVNGTTITYDQIGNPLSDGTWTYTWEKGRQLKSMSKSGTTASFKYNENGLRIQKTVNGVVTDYTIHGKNIVHMTQGSNNLHFFYDASNKPAIVEYNGTKYAYVHNLQGDIVAILDSNGTAVVQYKYDAWGKPFEPTGSMKDDLGKLNPFRYRGYVYDEETGLCYLRSRYYNVQQCRFTNCDSIISRNMFSYCSNTPVMAVDRAGTETAMLPFSRMGIGNLIAAVLHDGTSGAAIADVINPAQYAGLDHEAVDECMGAICEELLGFQTSGDMAQDLAVKGGVRFSTALIAGGFRRGGLRGAAAGGALAIVVMITAVGVGHTAKERMDGVTAYDEEEFTEEVASGIVDIPLGMIDIETGHPLSDWIVEKTIDSVKTNFVQVCIE